MLMHRAPQLDPQLLNRHHETPLAHAAPARTKRRLTPYMCALEHAPCQAKTHSSIRLTFSRVPCIRATCLQSQCWGDRLAVLGMEWATISTGIATWLRRARICFRNTFVRSPNSLPELLLEHLPFVGRWKGSEQGSELCSAVPHARSGVGDRGNACSGWIGSVAIPVVDTSERASMSFAFQKLLAWRSAWR